MESDEEGDLLAVRARNIAQLNQMFGSMFNQCQEICSDMKSEVDVIQNRQKPRMKRKQSDNFRFKGIVPTERRKSARLANSRPEFDYSVLDGLIDDDKDEDYEYDLEEIIHEPRRRKSVVYRNSLPAVVRAPEEITAHEIANISKRSGNKTYSQNGTSCHQCRQKTVDTKTICRSGRCVGVRGQFCGPCLKNRYGEQAEEALLDPNWACPPCRNLCNCSICRTRDGKRPTGILAPVVQQEGYSSVKDFLLTLAEKSILRNKKRYVLPNDDFSDITENENSDGVIDTLMDNYLEKITRFSMKRTTGFLTEENVELLLGFIDCCPLNPLRNQDRCELLGFADNLLQYSLLCDDYILLCCF